MMYLIVSDGFRFQFLALCSNAKIAVDILDKRGQSEEVQCVAFNGEQVHGNVKDFEGESGGDDVMVMVTTMKMTTHEPVYKYILSSTKAKIL